MENFYFWFYLKKAERICFKNEKILKISEKTISTFSMLKKQKKMKNFSYLNFLFFQLKFFKNIKEFTEFFILQFFNIQISHFFFREKENFIMFPFFKKQKLKKILFFYFSHNFCLKKKTQKNFLKRKKINYLSFSIIVEIQQWFFVYFQNFKKNLSFENFFFSFFEFFKSNYLVNEKPCFFFDQNGQAETQNKKIFKKTYLEFSHKNFFFRARCAKKQNFENFVFSQKFNTKFCSILKLNKFPLKNKRVWSFKFLKYCLAFVNFCLPETKFAMDHFSLQKKSPKTEKRKTNFQRNQKLQFKNQNFTRQFKDFQIYTQNKTTRLKVFSKKNKKLQFKFLDFSTQKVKSHVILKKNFFQNFFHFFSILFSSFFDLFFVNSFGEFFFERSSSFFCKESTFYNLLNFIQFLNSDKNFLARVPFFEKTRNIFSPSLKPDNSFSFWTRDRSSGTSCYFSTNELNSSFSDSNKISRWQKKWKEKRNWKNKTLNLEEIFLEKIKTFSIDLNKDMKYNIYLKKKFLFQKIFHNLKTFPNFFFQGQFKKQNDYFEQRVKQISAVFPYTKFESDFFISEQLNQKKDLNFLKPEEKHFLKFSINFNIKNKNVFFSSFFKNNFPFLFQYQKKNLELFRFFSPIVKIQFEKSFFHLFQFLDLLKIKQHFFQEFFFFSSKNFFSKKLFSFKFSWRKIKFIEKQKNTFCLNFFNFFDFSSISNPLSFFLLNFSYFEKNLQLFFETFGYFHLSFFKNFFLKDCIEKDILKNHKFFKTNIFQQEFRYFIFSFFKKKISFFLFEKEKMNVWLFSKKSFSLQITIQTKKFSKIFSFESLFLFLSKYLTTENFSNFRKKNTNLFFQKQRFFGCHFDEKNLFFNMFSNFCCFQEKYIQKKTEKKEWYLFFVFNSQIFSKLNFPFLKHAYICRPFCSFSVFKNTNIILFDWLFHQVSNLETLKLWVKNKTTQKNRTFTCSEFDKKIRKQNCQKFVLNNEKIFSFQKIPTQKNINFHLKECKWIIQNSKNQTQLNLMKKLNKKIQLWCKNYTASSAKQVFFYCDSMLLKFLWNWTRKIHSKKSKFWIRKKYFHFLPIPHYLKLNRTQPRKAWFFGKKIGTKFICLPLHSQRKVESF